MQFRNLVCCFAFILVGVTASYGQRTPSKENETTSQKADTLVRQQKNELKKAFQETKNSLPGSLPSTSPKKPGLPNFSEGDSVGVAYENGKVVLPGKAPSSADLKKINGKKALPTLKKPTTIDLKEKVKDLNTLPDSVTEFSAAEEQHKKLSEAKANREKLESRVDSIKQIAEKVDDVEQLLKEPLKTQHIYSSKSMKKLYDSLGISKLDSALALASTKKDVSKEELLEALNTSFEPSPFEGAKSGEDLAKTAGSDVKKEIPADLSKMKLLDTDLSQMPPLRGFQLPTDSIPFLDSVRQLNMEREKLKLNEKEIGEHVKSALVKEKPSFWDRTYCEGVVSFLKERDANVFQASPSMGFRVVGNLSVGLGPNILIKEVNKKWTATLGYRSFLKYEVYKQRGYLQVEDVVDPRQVDAELVKYAKHSVFAGGGYLVPVSKVLALNLCVLYRVNNKQYSGGQASPWNIRLGISSIGGKKKELK